MFAVLLEQSDLNLELQNADGETPLWLALKAVGPKDTYTDESFATKLFKKGSSLDATNSKTGA